MSFSICLIGNSHVAAIKQAWTNRGPVVQPDVSVDFFSAGTRLLSALTLEGTLWRAATGPLREKLAYTSGGQEDIELSRYDAFVMMGSGFGLDIPKFTAGYDIASPDREPEGTLMSRASFAAMIAA
ncbi:MAG TPA: hypothetical protein VHE09_05885 [Rhizomicrobium sp.]|jgi:hypothetical protein|nr:hypothetical protein [Rhizomicrobium sp.]